MIGAPLASQSWESQLAKVTIPSPAALKDFLGKEFPPSDWLTVEQAHIDAFAEATGDRQWIHVDRERAARESPFGTTIAHGNLILSLAPRLLAQIVEVEGVTIMVNPGFEKVRIRVPVKEGSRLRMGAALAKVREIKGGAVRCSWRMRFEVEGDERAAALGEVHVVYYP
jgi:acyl dehydratase